MTKHIIVLGLVGLLVPGWAAAQPPATPVGVDQVRFEPMAQTVPVLGRFVSSQSGNVAARAAGPVAKLHVNVGDHVEQQQILAELDQDRLKTQLALQQAELKALEASRQNAIAKEQYAKKELERITQLRGSAAFSQFDFDTRKQELALAVATRQEAEARIAQGQVNKQLAEIELRDGVIRAPYPGVVTLRHTNEGAWVKIGDPVLTLINDVDLEIEADVPANRLDGLRLGEDINATLDDGTRFTATIRAVIPDENPASRTRPARLLPKLQNTAAVQPLAVNQPVTLQVPASGASEVLSVAKDAVIRRGSDAMVFVVNSGSAEPRPVSLGQAMGDRFQVLDGLEPGDIVVVRGNERLRPGQKVAYPGKPPGPSPDSDQPPAAATDAQG